MSNIVIKAENIGKRYIIGHEAAAGRRERYTALRNVIAHILTVLKVSLFLKG
jgi:hypothetical protein